ncbi:MAG: transposase [Gammaproteobacteria bacterium]|nr:transposase [Gammaproteobacteria bacterium]
MEGALGSSIRQKTVVFGSALNLNMHLHMLFLDAAYLTGTGEPVFRQVPAPGAALLQGLVQLIAGRVRRLLEKRGLIERDG